MKQQIQMKGFPWFEKKIPDCISSPAFSFGGCAARDKKKLISGDSLLTDSIP
ncbi:MAG: hypothetical protein R2794_12365 [Chitinophagales bacterium]